MAVRIPYYLFSHNRKVANLYKKWLRHLEGSSSSRIEYRFKAALARAEFESILYEKDMRKSKQMILDKEEALYTHFSYEPAYFVDEPRGCAYKRQPLVNDYLLDFWHPYEKAVFPDYFAKRELRKQQYLEQWEKQYGPPQPDDH